MLSIFIEGFLLQASLILALGAQNIFVIESGIKKQNHILVAFVCFLCDFILVTIGIIGAAKLFVAFPLFKTIIGATGVLFLLYYALLKANEALNPKPEQSSDSKIISKKQSLISALAFSLLNPHVYLDTVVLIGGYSGKFISSFEKLCFGSGVVGFSFVWFLLLAIASQYLKNSLQSNHTMRLFNLTSSIILMYLCYSLAIDVLNW
ncbi:MAG: LysE family transporter [Candidatus Cloacimonetes bacterium]|nr:LysE family transporter [Candidatus Cloacimonadota bacterium]